MIYAFLDYELDGDILELRRGGTRVAVQPKVLDLLFLVVRAGGRVVDKAETLQTLWPGVSVDDTAFARAVMGARRAIGDDGDSQATIVTVRGRGIRFAAPVDERPAQLPSSRRTSHPPPSRVPLVGRDACIAALAERLDDAIAGRGAFACVSGEAGIGKTRVIEEVARLARGRGATALSARGHRGSGAPRYWAWTQLARALAEDGSPDPSASPQTTEGEFALADEMGRCLLRAARRGPLVVTIEDLDCLDEASIRVLHFVARSLRDASIVVVATYRDATVRAHGVAASPDLDGRWRAIGALLREYPDHVSVLRPLAKRDVGSLVAAICGIHPPPMLLDTVYEKTSGNPLYVVQLAGTGWLSRAIAEPERELASSLDMGHSLLASIEQHLDELPPECRDLLATAAVLGSSFALATLARAARKPSLAVLDLLEDAVRAKILVKPPGSLGSYDFSYALVRDAIYKRMSEADRVARHSAVGEALVAHGDDSLLMDIARHFLRAATGGDAGRAIDFALRAAARAAEHGDQKRSIRLLEQARDACGLTGGERHRAAVAHALKDALAARR